MSPWVRQAPARDQTGQPSATRRRIDFFIDLLMGVFGLAGVFFAPSHFTNDLPFYILMLVIYVQRLLTIRRPPSKFQSVCRCSLYGYCFLGLVGSLLEKYSSPVPLWIRLALWLIFATLMTLLEQWVVMRRQKSGAMVFEARGA
jgi:hypothetical protein